MSPSGLIWTK